MAREENVKAEHQVGQVDRRTLLTSLFGSAATLGLPPEKSTAKGVVDPGPPTRAEKDAQGQRAFSEYQTFIYDVLAKGVLPELLGEMFDQALERNVIRHGETPEEKQKIFTDVIIKSLHSVAGDSIWAHLNGNERTWKDDVMDADFFFENVMREVERIGGRRFVLLRPKIRGFVTELSKVARERLAPKARNK